MVKQKTKSKFKLPSTYLKKPNFDKTKISDFELGTKKLEQEDKLRKKIAEDYAKQEAKISLGQMPSKTRAEFESFIRKDITKRQKISSLRMNPMSEEQNMLGSLFGGGDKVIFNNPESRSLPEIHGDLMPHSFGDEVESETAETFGFGRFKQRSGLF